MPRVLHLHNYVVNQIKELAQSNISHVLLAWNQEKIPALFSALHFLQLYITIGLRLQSFLSDFSHALTHLHRLLSAQ